MQALTGLHGLQNFNSQINTTMNPPTGHYRTILADTHPEVRIAIADVPMSGVIRIPPDEILKVLDESEDMWAPTYAQRIRNGTYVTIVESQFANTYYKPGELFFKS